MSKISKNITYTLKHWFYYQKVALELNVWHPRHLLHDLDKIVMYLHLSKKETSKLHRRKSKHHLENAGDKKINYLDAIIDWECARYTKPDKKLNARETMEGFYMDHESKINPILIKLGL